MITHAGTARFCLVRFISLFFLEVFFLAAMLQIVEYLALFLSVSSTFTREAVLKTGLPA
jgi:hypothetical protein